MLRVATMGALKMLDVKNVLQFYVLQIGPSFSRPAFSVNPRR